MALRLAGWPDDRAVWTGSCPCQPFSTAGKGGGFADERHLWPEFHRLIEKRRPPVIFGEQVASKDGLSWLDLVCADMEASGYAVGAADMCAAGIGAPHIRQRLWFVGVEHGAGVGRVERRAEPSGRRAASGRSNCGVADGQQSRLEGHAGHGYFGNQSRRIDAEPLGSIAQGGGNSGACPIDGFWRDADWLWCRDGKWRSVEPGTFPLAHGVPARVGRLRAYGNAIVPQVAAQFIGAYLGT